MRGVDPATTQFTVPVLTVSTNRYGNLPQHKYDICTLYIQVEYFQIGRERLKIYFDDSQFIHEPRFFHLPEKTRLVSYRIKILRKFHSYNLSQLWVTLTIWVTGIPKQCRLLIFHFERIILRIILFFFFSLKISRIAFLFPSSNLTSYVNIVQSLFYSIIYKDLKRAIAVSNADMTDLTAFVISFSTAVNTSYYSVLYNSRAPWQYNVRTLCYVKPSVVNTVAGIMICG